MHTVSAVLQQWVFARADRDTRYLDHMVPVSWLIDCLTTSPVSPWRLRYCIYISLSFYIFLFLHQCHMGLASTPQSTHLPSLSENTLLGCLRVTKVPSIIYNSRLRFWYQCRTCIYMHLNIWWLLSCCHLSLQATRSKFIIWCHKRNEWDGIIN